MDMLGLDTISGCASDSIIITKHLVRTATTARIASKLTLISNDVDATAPLRDAQGMVLHSWAATNIPEDQNLHGGFGLRGGILSRSSAIFLLGTVATIL